MDRVIPLDLSRLTVRELNHYLHHELPNNGAVRVEILNPNGQHSLAVGLDAPAEIDILGHAGYFIAGMNKQANITVHGNVGWSVAENIMSGTVRVKGCASECAGASGHGEAVLTVGIENLDPHRAVVGQFVMQELIQLAHRQAAQVERDDTVHE